MADREKNAVVLSGLLHAVARFNSDAARVAAILRRLDGRGIIDAADDANR
jgi:hypothetical protein